MRRENLFTAELDLEQTREGHRWRAARLGGRLGAELIVSASHQPSISVYPDSDKLGTRPPDRDDVLNFRRADAVDYWDGE